MREVSEHALKGGSLVLLLLLLLQHLEYSFGAKENENTKGPIDYSKLEMDKKYLLGSRWGVEQLKEGKVMIVYNAIEIVDLSKVDVSTMSVRVEFLLRQRWNSPDLELPEGLFHPDDNSHLCVQTDPAILQGLGSPDSFIPLARETKISSVSTQQSIVNIFKNKTIVFESRMYTILGCHFDFQWYPLDRQACNLTIESYTFPDRIVNYLWEDYQPIVTRNVKLLQYSLQFPLRYTNGTAVRWNRAELYPYVTLILEFERQLGHQIIQSFIPTILVVVLSWFSFWLGLDAVPGRITLLVTCMLTLVTMHSAQSSLPPVNYIKMMDIWMVGCMSFVFLALLEFVVVKFLHWRKSLELKAKEEGDKEMKEYLLKIREMGDDRSKEALPMNPYLEFYRSLNAGGTQGLIHMHPTPRMFPPPGGPKPASPWVRIDQISRVAIPLSFLVFNGIFWPWLLIGSENQAVGLGGRYRS